MSEQKTAKITEVVSIREWDGPHGKIYFHKVLLDNNELVDFGKKVEGALKVGDSITYTAELTEHGLKGKEVREFGGGGGFKGGGKAFSDPKTMILAYAKDVEVALIGAGFPADDSTASIINRADAFLNWYNGAKSADTVSVAGDTDTEFSGDGMKQVPAVEPLKPQPSGQIRQKPQTGGGGDAATPPQLNLLIKLAGERGVNVNQMIAQNWTDITDESQLSKWATSYLIDVLMATPR